MARKDDQKYGRAVPSRRLSRLMGLGGVAANVAGRMAIGGAKKLAAGKRPKLNDLLLTPKNAKKLTEQLSSMRGAAMKMGQMLSMDSGDFLPKEIADVLARLRSDAQPMPRAQLDSVLNAELGSEWASNFLSFQYYPLAAASIGQVQSAVSNDGDYLAIKVQYPGVRESIDSDVNNLASLVKLSGLLPKGFDIKPLIEECRRQLHEEADYCREAEDMTRYGAFLAADENFQVPEYFAEFSTDRVLAMSFIDGEPIESLETASQETRDRVVSCLFDLLYRELFEFKLMQTDPNFANYRYNPDTGQIILLDFGACREVSDDLSKSYLALMTSLISGDADACFARASDMGFIPDNLSDELRGGLKEIIATAIEPLSRDEVFDFGDNPITDQVKDAAMELAGERELWHLPPPETVFIQRKLGGMHMLATRLRAKVNVHALLSKYVEK